MRKTSFQRFAYSLLTPCSHDRNPIEVFETNESGCFVCQPLSSYTYEEIIQKIKQYHGQMGRKKMCGNISATLMSPDSKSPNRTNYFPLNEEQTERIISADVFQPGAEEHQLHAALKQRRSTLQCFICPRAKQNDTTLAIWNVTKASHVLFASAYLAFSRLGQTAKAGRAIVQRLASLLMVAGQMQTRRRIIPCKIADSRHYSATVRAAAWGDNTVQVLADAGLAASTVSQTQLLDTVPESSPDIIDQLLESTCLAVARMSFALEGRSIVEARLIHKLDEHGAVWFCGATENPKLGMPAQEMDIQIVSSASEHFFGRSSLADGCLSGGASAAIGSSQSLLQQSSLPTGMLGRERGISSNPGVGLETYISKETLEGLDLFGEEYKQKLECEVPFPEPPPVHKAAADLDAYMRRRKISSQKGAQQAEFLQFWESLQPKDVLLQAPRTRKELERLARLRRLAYVHTREKLHQKRLKNATAGAISSNSRIPHTTLRMMETSGTKLDGGSAQVQPLHRVRPEAFDMTTLGQIAVDRGQSTKSTVQTTQAVDESSSSSHPKARAGYGKLSKFSVHDADGLEQNLTSAMKSPTFVGLLDIQPGRFETANRYIAEQQAARAFASNKEIAGAHFQNSDAAPRSDPSPRSARLSEMSAASSHVPTEQDVVSIEDFTEQSISSHSLVGMEDSLFAREAAVIRRGHDVSALVDSPPGRRTKMIQYSPGVSAISSIDSVVFGSSPSRSDSADWPSDTLQLVRPVRDDRHPYEKVADTLKERKAFLALHKTASPSPPHIAPATTRSFARTAASRARAATKEIRQLTQALPPVPEAVPLSRQAQKMVHGARKQLAQQEGVHHSTLPSFGASAYISEVAKKSAKRRAGGQAPGAAAHSTPFTLDGSGGLPQQRRVYKNSASTTIHRRDKSKDASKQHAKQRLRLRTAPARTRVPRISDRTYQQLFGTASHTQQDPLLQKARAAFGDAAESALKEARSRMHQYGV